MSETAMLPSPAAATAPRRRSKESVGSVGRCRTRWSDGCVRISLRLVRGTQFRSLVASGGRATDRQRAVFFRRRSILVPTVGRYWANHAWLSETGMYLVHRSLGGGALVVFKAAIVALIASVMFWMAARPRSDLVADELHPARHTRHDAAPAPSTLGHLVLHAGALPRLPPCGRVLVSCRADPDRALGQPGFVVRSGAAARCAVLGWPAARFQSGCAGPLAGLAGPRLIAGLPLQSTSRLWIDAATGTISGRLEERLCPGPAVRECLLIAVELVRFWRSRRLRSGVVVVRDLDRTRFSFLRAELEALRSWRCLVWIAFAALACWQARLVPFFAVVAGPITVLNLGELVPERAFRRPGRAAHRGIAGTGCTGVARMDGGVPQSRAWGRLGHPHRCHACPRRDRHRRVAREEWYSARSSCLHHPCGPRPLSGLVRTGREVDTRFATPTLRLRRLRVSVA